MDTGILPIADRSAIAAPQSLDSLAVGKPNSSGRSDISSSQYSSPDVQVHLSQLGRQLAIEALEKESVQASQASEAFQTERRNNQNQIDETNNQDRFTQNTVNYAQVENDETLDVGTQEKARLETGQRVEPEIVNTRPEPEPVEVRDQREVARERVIENSEARNAAVVNEQASTPANTSRSASVVTQYNISPESALGQSISAYV